ncbi:hypothetical protein GCM10027289_07960 [Tsukamurella serpentis]
MTPPRLPAGTPTGYALGVACAAFPNQLPRTVGVQIMVCLLLGALGALAGAACARGRGGGGLRPAAYLIAGALMVWLLWQNRLRTAAGVDPLGPIGFAVLTVVVAAAPLVVAALWARRRRTVIAALGVCVAAGVAWPATAQAPDPGSQAQRFAGIDSATPGIRVYAALSDGDSPSRRATVAVDRLIAAGGLRRAAVVIAVPTGSGWVDPHFVRGVERTMLGDSAIVAVQYTEIPSWRSYLLHRDAPARTAAAVIEELHRRSPSTPVRLYGQSLGAVGVLAAGTRAAELGQPVTGTLQVGTPAGVGLGGPVQLNASDPVGIWSPRLLYAPADRAPSGTGTATPRPPWVPVLGFVQATVDLLGATAPPPGLGHRYGERQGSDLVADLIEPVYLPTSA